ncbi:MAG: O-antigen ligase family protein [Turicibacter sanguinis]|uniref:O-antigen ligase family protein n=1 Tax=Turicibacter sanguinis TaxID=154288 RepID=UPI002F9539A4
MRISLDKILYLIMVLFPLTTIIQGIPSFSFINTIMVGLMIVILSFFSLIERQQRSTMIMLFLSLFNYVLAYMLTDSSIFRINDLFYFPFWILFLNYVSNHFLKIKSLLDHSYRINNFVLISWNIIVFISLFFSSSYTHHWGEGTYFMSFSNGEHRFASSAFFIVVLALYMFLKTRKKKYFILLIFPAISIFMSGARTYLAVLVGALFLFLYKRIKNKPLFYVICLLCGILLFYLVMVSPMGEKMIYVMNPGDQSDLLNALTSNRASFWSKQLNAFFSLNYIYLIFGAGFNFVYDVSNIWAHNDFINILLNFGFLGVFMYLYFYIILLKKNIQLYKIKKMESFICVMIWLFNAMFNMVYTYMCATLTLPFLYYLIMEEKYGDN